MLPLAMCAFIRIYHAPALRFPTEGVSSLGFDGRPTSHIALGDEYGGADEATGAQV